MESQYEAYADYLERMYEKTDDLTPVDKDIYPDYFYLPKLQEWQEWSDVD